MDTHPSRPRPLRNVTATATATGSALAVVLLPLVVGALVARSAGADPMASVNALIAGGGERAKLSRSHLPALRDIRRAPRRAVGHLTRRPSPHGRRARLRLLAGREDVRVEVAHGRER
ncbi:hypothetical protein F9278_03920 [Streptomyces phaeolivaceus]|uniref:Uncharacterized protein n=1 Tax=Streptomyces phaeolivaceus TaxID=2653200 RepID=A0A5P8JYK5_9ACTN|nr:hypothetical protein [Streptomyces phaeolivaceus]QFQ95477.1 hypothetical protein F9278_03920 [Streptomyces phaeolivaceus]